MSGRDAVELFDHAADLFDACQENGDVDMLRDAVALFRDAVAATPDDDPLRRDRLLGLTAGLGLLRRHTSEISLLIEQAQVLRAVASASDDPAECANLLLKVSALLRQHLEDEHDVAVLAELIATHRALVSSLGEIRSDRLWVVVSLSAALYVLYSQTGDVDLLRERAEADRIIAAATPPASPEYADRAYNRGINLLMLRQEANDPAFLAEEAEAFRAAAAGTPAGHPDRALRLRMLSDTLAHLSERTGDDSLLAEETDARRGEVAALPADAPDRWERTTRLGSCLLALFERVGDSDLLTEAAATYRSALLAIPADPKLTVRAHEIGSDLDDFRKRTGNRTLLSVEVEADRAAAAAVPEADPGRPAFLSNLGISLLLLAEQAGDAEAGTLLAEAVDVSRESVAATPAADPSLASRLTSYYLALRDLRQRSGSTRYLTDEVEAGRAAVTATAADDPQRTLVGYFFVSLWELVIRADECGLSLADEVAVLREAIAYAPADDPERGNRLALLAIKIYELRSDGDRVLLAENVDVARAAAAAMPKDSPFRGTVLATLGFCLLARSMDPYDSGTLGEAIDAATQARAVMAPDDPLRAATCYAISLAHQVRFDHCADSSELEAAIVAGQEAVTVALRGDPQRGSYRNHLSDLRLLKAERTGATSEIAEAVDMARRALADKPVGSLGRADSLNSLGFALRQQFERTGDAALLAESATVLREATASPGAPPIAFANLAAALCSSYRQSGEQALLDEAVQVARSAVALAPDGSQYRSGCLSVLSDCLLRQFERTGDMAALTEAIDAQRSSMTATRDAAGYGRSANLANLSVLLRLRYERTGDLNALSDSVHAARESVTAMGAGSPLLRAFQLNNLANALTLLFQRTMDQRVLAEAVSAFESALDAVPAQHPRRAMVLGNFCISLRQAGEIAGDAKMLRRAADLGRKAMAMMPADHPDRTRYQHCLGQAWSSLAAVTGQKRHAAHAIDNLRAAVAATPAGTPSSAIYLRNLGEALQQSHALTGRADQLAEAERSYATAARDTAGAAYHRIVAYCEASALAERRADGAADALALAEAAVRLLPQLDLGSLRLPDRQHSMGRLHMLAGQVASAAIAAGRPDRAVELLELTRGVATADITAVDDGSIERLHAVAPELAEEFTALRMRLAISRVAGTDAQFTGHDTPGDVAGGDNGSRLAQERRDAQAAWEVMLSRIRAISGFENFLDSPPAAQLTALAREGPVVIVTVSRSRADALILTGDSAEPVRHVPLPGITQLDADRNADRLAAMYRAYPFPRGQLSLTHGDMEAVIRGILAWLWDALAEPVLSALGYQAPPSDASAWPRLWWCPVGPLALLPVHAAGHHEDLASDDPARRASPRTVLDRVVSSYATTLRGLAAARAGRPHEATRAALIVAVPDGGGNPLPNVTAEAESVREFLPGASLLASAGRADVLAALPGHDIVHFACHAHADLANPAASYLRLHGNQSERLTVADICALRLTGGLAYLSACKTSHTLRLNADEGLHITGAFHLAGYRHVIGSMWPVIDSRARDVAIDFYRFLTNDGTRPPVPERAARALHDTIRQMRATYLRVPSFWFAHTHTGP